MDKSLQDFLQEYKPKIDQAIEAELVRRMREVSKISPHLTSVIKAMQELSVGGKRLRGLLTLIGYELAGGKINSEVVRAAVVMELFHLGLLIQDDVMDRDPLRRGVPTIHTRYPDMHHGESMATLAGDLTFGWGMEAVATLQSPITKLQITSAMRVWGQYFSRVGYGQMLDVLQVADENSVLQILSLKSGEYSCVLPLVFGATLGGGGEQLAQRLTEYGMALGWVFQLRDDYLSEWGGSEQTGKPVGNDRREGKHSFALMYGRDKLLSEIESHAKCAVGVAREIVGAEALIEIVDWVKQREN